MVRLYNSEMVFHDFQRTDVFTVGLNYAVLFLKTYSVHVMGAGGQEYDVVVSCQG